MLRRHAIASLLAVRAWTKEIAAGKSAGRFFDGAHGAERQVKEIAGQYEWRRPAASKFG